MIHGLELGRTYYIVARLQTADGAIDVNTREVQVTAPKEWPPETVPRCPDGSWHGASDLCGAGALGVLDVAAGAGRFLVRCYDGGFSLWNVDASGRPEKVADLTEEPRPYRKDALSSDGNLLATTYMADHFSRLAQSEVLVRSLPDLKEQWHRSLGFGPCGRAAWHPSGRWLATANHDQPVRIWDGPTGRLRAETPPLPGSVTGLVWDPEGMRLAVVLEGALLVWAPPGALEPTGFILKRERPEPSAYQLASQRIVDPCSGWQEMAWSGNGETLALLTSCHRGSCRGVFLNTSNWSPQGFFAAASVPRALLLSPSGQRLVINEGRDSTHHMVIDVPSGRMVCDCVDGWPLHWADDDCLLTTRGMSAPWR